MLTSVFSMLFAYLDAGTGSMIVAAIAGGAAGIMVVLRLFGRRILGVFFKKYRDPTEETSEETSEELTDISKVE